MNFIRVFALLSVLASCTKTIGHSPAKTQDPGSVTPAVTNCQYQSTSSISFSATINSIFKNNCLPCHSAPGSGGINLDSYPSIKSLAQGELMDVVLYNPSGIQMPPPPQKLLDSCQIKAINLWIKQGCLFN